MGNICFRHAEPARLLALRDAIAEAVDAERAATAEPLADAGNWNTPALRGLLAPRNQAGSLNQDAETTPLLEGAGEIRGWAQAVLREYVSRVYPGGEVSVQIEDSGVTVGRHDSWRGPAPHSNPGSELTATMYLSCPSSPGTCRLRLTDPRPKADASGGAFHEFLGGAKRNAGMMNRATTKAGLVVGIEVICAPPGVFS
jgi:hypothetical protein